ncbi:MAG: acetyl/propionyl/methylcrotonyl-CoA carboxylase subunit alpha [Rhodothalassiaceae bacterium]
MFRKILIANRGEIACRIIKTARRMGIATVAVYSDADRDALHVEMADEHVHIGPAPVAESYLKADRIIAAAKETGAEAIHPGFGFLSERARFVEDVEAAGLVFIGPSARAIEAMGDKIESKRLAEKAGVNTVPGHIGEIVDAEEAVRIAREIGYPVMIKASAGGGGKGMRIAWNDDDCREGFASARSEAKTSFGDDRVFIEKYIVEPRHIEIQLLGDGAGNLVYLHERECSIQRRHQKVIEEAPSPFLDDATRRAMGEQAVALGRVVEYRSAGTVEFIVDRERNFYFLEMNTRLQVEHPVTEMITGLDLVEQMIRIAAGETLALRQEDVPMRGWAIESRIYAEDPRRDFLPSIGRLTRCLAPEEAPDVRVDTGVFEGAEISMFYDPMIAKLVTWGETREKAIATMAEALDSYYIRGIAHNVPFLSAVMAHPRFREGRLSTNFIAEEFPEGFTGTVPTPGQRRRLIAVAAVTDAIARMRAGAISGRILDSAPAVGQPRVALIEGEHVTVTVEADEDGFRIRFEDGESVVRSDWRPGQPVFRGTIDGVLTVVELDRAGIGHVYSAGGASLAIPVLAPHVAALLALMPEKQAADSSKLLLCPMPGLVLSIAVSEGEEVKAGQALAVVEAMKMENILRAERDGIVTRIHVKPGDSLAVDATIMEFA